MRSLLSLKAMDFIAIFLLFTTTNAAPGDIMCRYTATTPSVVNYYMCQDFADYYDIPIDEFFELNPSLDPDCDNVKPDTEYCVAGMREVLTSTDGYCGPKHGDTSCIGTEKQCCNSQTWRCGDSTEDCAAGTCYEGACMGDASMFSLDGKCGPSTGDKICTGRWGPCCNYDGLCGSGPDFCAKDTCQAGACIMSNADSQPLPSNLSPDGTCGGAGGYNCKGSGFGDCCSSVGYCGSSSDHCETGCQFNYGDCKFPKLVWDPETGTYEVAKPSTSKNMSKDGSCGGSQKLTCSGTSFGECCSKGGYCGDTASHCGQGCQLDFSSKCLASNVPSIDGTCGSGGAGFTCAGGPFDGQCCSAEGWCGASADHCGSGCQKGYGRCN